MTNNKIEETKEKIEKSDVSSGNLDAVKLSDENKELKAKIAELKKEKLQLITDVEEVRKSKSRLESQVDKKLEQNAAKTALEVIDVVDILEQATNSVSNEERKNNSRLNDTLQGIELIKGKLIGVFNKISVKEQSNLIGKKFDSQFHEAVNMVAASEEQKSGTIVKVHQAGYLIGKDDNKRALRTAKVTVAK